MIALLVCVLVTNICACYLGYHIGRAVGYKAGVTMAVFTMIKEVNEMLQDCSRPTQEEFLEALDKFNQRKEKEGGS
jgi:hypothetical protein